MRNGGKKKLLYLLPISLYAVFLSLSRIFCSCLFPPTLLSLLPISLSTGFPSLSRYFLFLSSQPIYLFITPLLRFFITLRLFSLVYGFTSPILSGFVFDSPQFIYISGQSLCSKRFFSTVKSPRTSLSLSPSTGKIKSSFYISLDVLSKGGGYIIMQ